MVTTFLERSGTRLCGNRIYGAFVLNRRVDLHAIDATSARWRGDAGSSPLDGASAAMSSPRNDLVKNYRVRPTHCLISTQVPGLRELPPGGQFRGGPRRGPRACQVRSGGQAPSRAAPPSSLEWVAGARARTSKHRSGALPGAIFRAHARRPRGLVAAEPDLVERFSKLDE